MLDFLMKNVHWQLNQQPFKLLICPTTNLQQLYNQLMNVTDKYFPEYRKIDTLETEFCLNKIALTKARNVQQKMLKLHYYAIWDSFVHLKHVFDNKFALFPASYSTRLERVAELICKCTQFCLSSEQLQEILHRTSEIVPLTEQENRHLTYVVSLYKIKLYCALYFECVSNTNCHQRVAYFLQNRLLDDTLKHNSHYSQKTYTNGNLLVNLNCFGNSLVSVGKDSVCMHQKLYVFANGRNVFDTFCNSSFGQNTAKFQSDCVNLTITMHYYLKDNCEIKNVTIKNNGDKKRTLSIQCPTQFDGKYTQIANDDCFAFCTNNDGIYCATNIWQNNAPIGTFVNGILQAKFTLNAHDQLKFDIVNCYSESMPMLALTIQNLHNFASTYCPYLSDQVANDVKRFDLPLNVTPHGYVTKCQLPNNEKVRFTYQLGNSDIATFVSNEGNETTLIDGFVFGLAGASIYKVQSGHISKLNEGKFAVTDDKIQYQKQNCSCNIFHTANSKVYSIEYSNSTTTLFYFPLLNKSTISLTQNTFEIYNNNGTKIWLKFFGNVQCYTTSMLECNSSKLRYKLSNNLTAGQCLAVTIGSCTSCKVEITCSLNTPQSTPIVKQSTLCAGLNYLNEKSIFCLNNHLCKANNFTLASICYTNPQYVRQYVTSHYAKSLFYYDTNGYRQDYQLPLLLPLAVAYYSNLIADNLPNEIKLPILNSLLDLQLTGTDLCVQALALLKSTTIDGIDKLKYVVKYENLKKIIMANSALYTYAQAIGAVPLSNPSKQRLKDLCNQHKIAKYWYYVSQLENLYGIKICKSTLNVVPKVSAENALESLCLCLDGKNINVTFAKANSCSMIINGVKCFTAFCPSTLQREQNNLVVQF